MERLRKDGWYHKIDVVFLEIGVDKKDSGWAVDFLL